MNLKDKKVLLERFIPFILEGRSELFDRILVNRTRHMTIAIEDVYTPHNASAIIRSCDCFGIQDVHIIENQNEYELSDNVTIGSAQWVDVMQYNSKKNNTMQCINSLKSNGYKIVATTPHTNDISVENFDVSERFALFMGTEKRGLSELVLDNSDEFVKIPMVGFSESLNISVSAAICMQQFTRRIRSNVSNWQLNEEDQVDLKLNWIRSTVKTPELIEARLLSEL